jgi:hypothetical protein
MHDVHKAIYGKSEATRTVLGTVIWIMFMFIFMLMAFTHEPFRPSARAIHTPRIS